MAKPVDDAVATIAAAISSSGRPRRWHDGLPPEHAKIVGRIREAWKAGQFGTKRRAAARQIAAYLNSAGISSIGTQGIDQWLQRA